MKIDSDRKLPKMEDLFIDIGVSSRKEAERLLRVGDPITLSDTFDTLRGDLVVARAFDNRVGTFAVAEALRQLSEEKSKLQRGSSGRLQHHGGSRLVGRPADRLHAQARCRAGGRCDPRD